MPDSVQTMLLPATWKQLLAIEDLESLSPVPSRHRSRDDHTADLTPYRDDYRAVSQVMGDRLVIAMLCSGSTNYWLDWRVERRPGGATLFPDGNGDVDFDISPRQEMTLSDGTRLQFRVKTVAHWPVRKAVRRPSSSKTCSR